MANKKKKSLAKKKQGTKKSNPSAKSKKASRAKSKQAAASKLAKKKKHSKSASASKVSAPKRKALKPAPKKASRKSEAVERRYKLSESAITERIGFFGGSFNPIHYGHLNSLESVRAAFSFNEVWVVPSHQSPLRPQEEGPTPEQKIEMSHIALQSLDANEEFFKIKDNEIKRGGISYTIETIREFMSEKPTAEFSVIIGADQLEKFDQWKDFSELLSRANLIVTSRPGNEIPYDKSGLPAGVRALVKRVKDGVFYLKTGMTIQFLQLNDIEVSSSEVRKKIRIGEKVDHLIPSGIVEYVKKHGIYHEVLKKIDNYEQFTRFCSQILDDKGALEIRGYDVRNMTQPAEYTLVASGTSTRHTKALAEAVIKQVKEQYGVFPQGTEGTQEGRWVVVDYGTLMIHLFYDFVRSEYRIEDIWASGNKLF